MSEEANRLRKAIRLADVIASQCAECLEAAIEDDGSTLKNMPDEWWRAVHIAASTRRPPSAETKAVVVELLQQRRDLFADPHLRGCSEVGAEAS